MEPTQGDEGGGGGGNMHELVVYRKVTHFHFHDWEIIRETCIVKQRLNSVSKDTKLWQGSNPDLKIS